MKFTVSWVTGLAFVVGVGCTPPLTSSDPSPSDPDESGAPPSRKDTKNPAPTPSTPPSKEPPPKVCIEKGSTVSPNQQSLQGAFAASCAGCHGASGDGVGKFPSLHEDKGFATFAKVVREGREGKAGVMPSFAATYLSDAELLRIYAALVDKPITADATFGCAAASSLSPSDIEAAFQQGLEAWRAPDHEGAACASCHGVMPIDLAFIGYDDATIYRRALKHITDAQTRKVVAFVHAIRAKYGIEGPRDFLSFRPFQPGGKPLEGATAAERDHKLGLNLAQIAPTLFEGVLDTKEKARRAKDEMLAINPRTFPIGVALNRWTEDIHHGAEHGTFNEWIPDRPHLPKDEAARKTLYALHDQYIANPSWQNLWAIEGRLGELTRLTGVEPGPTGGNNFAGFAYGMYQLKFRSVLFAQHHFLEELTGGNTLAKSSAAPFPARNALWELADFARVSSDVHFVNDCRSTWTGCMGLPPDAVEKLAPTADPRVETNRLKLAWFWVGWFFDTTLYQTSGSNSTKVSEYFTGTLYEEGYYNHVVYHRIRKNLAAAYELGREVPDALGQPGIDHPWAHTYGYYMGYGRGIDPDKMPQDPAALALYKTFAANTLRMMVLLATDEIERTKRVSSREAMAKIYGSESAFLRFSAAHAADPAKDQAMAEAYNAAISAACERRPLRYGEAPYPENCSSK